ncbi:MAG: DUF177 domain-containing protein [Clostridia bacterium]|nr:DUF177 domain-containing protein [Clostridia bacterium]
MILEIKKLNALKKYVGDFEYSYKADNDKLILPLTEFSGDIKVWGKYEIYDDDSVGIDLNIAYKIKGQCSYCLNNAEKDIEFFEEILFVPENDPDNYYYDGNKLDLTAAVNEAILFSQPDVLLCKPDCKGINVN